VRKIVHRHLGKVVAGAAIAVTGTAVMVGITLPGSAGADSTAGTTGQAAGQAGQDQAQGQGQGQEAVKPGVVDKAPPAEGEKGKGRDPLTDDEMERAEKIAVTRQMFSAAEDVEGDRGPQQLSAGLTEPDAEQLDDPNAPRRADVTVYDYKNDTLVTRTVNLDTGKVEETSTQRGVQPPISHTEMTEAVQLLLADPLGAGLKADYKGATGKELTSPDQLEYDSMVFKAVPGGQPDVLAKCGEHRCVTLFPKVRNGPWIDSRDLIVDLSARKVGKLG
jgi:hypothetical protein